MEVTAFRVQQNRLKPVRDALKSMRDQYFDVYVCVLSPNTTNYVMNQVSPRMIILSIIFIIPSFHHYYHHYKYT